MPGKRKVSLLLFIVVLFSGYYCFAEMFTSKQEIMESKGFRGYVDSFIQPDPVQGIKYQIVVINDQGKDMRFTLPSGLGVYGPDWEVLNLKKVNLKDKVLIEYTTNKNGDINKAISIMVMKNQEK